MNLMKAVNEISILNESDIFIQFLKIKCNLLISKFLALFFKYIDNILINYYT